MCGHAQTSVGWELLSLDNFWEQTCYYEIPYISDTVKVLLWVCFKEEINGSGYFLQIMQSIHSPRN